VKRLLFSMHDVSFPCDPDEDFGRGSPSTRASQRLFAYVRALGFTGIQLGPQGLTSRSNPSPYDGTLFSRHFGNISAHTWRALVGDAAVDRWVVSPGRAQNAHAYDACHALLAQAFTAERMHPRTLPPWMESDALYAALCAERGGVGFRDWEAPVRNLWIGDNRPLRDELLARHADHIAMYAYGQLLAQQEHDRVRSTANLALYGDFQIGCSDADLWRCAPVFLRDYLLGAPPSRTNPEGQPWGYPVLDPAQYTGAAAALILQRAYKVFSEYDGLRVDHPHGIVCPWVYRSDSPDPAQAVRDGARLFESPDLPDHPGLAAYAIVRPDQIDRTKPRFDNDWVHDLDAAQIERYGFLVGTLLRGAVMAGKQPTEITCEVLSTMPAPLGAVLARYGLGRWRVTQKANLDDITDVYRLENAKREDWVMLGNHDTEAILSVIRAWTPTKREQWARHLAARLRLDHPERLTRDGFLATAMLADMLASEAENVSIFFADLFGYTERFNIPGVIDDANWCLRLTPDFEALHAQRLADHAALDIGLAVDLALVATFSA